MKIWDYSSYTQIIFKNFYVFFIQYKKGKMLSLPTKERKATVSNDDLIYRKKFSLLFGSLPSAE